MTQQFPVYVALPAEMYAEFILRSGKHIDVGARIASIIQDFLDRTYGDPNIWSDEHAEKVGEQDGTQAELRQMYGDLLKGYQWQTVFLPNGTKVRMLYQGQYSYAEIQHEKLVHEGSDYSPSEFARKVANDTSRNAWRDLDLQFPGSKEWEQANVVRKQRLGGRRP